MAAKGTGQHDAFHGLAQFIDQQLCARIQRPFCQLNGAHIGLGHTDFRFPAMQDIGEGSTFPQNTVRAGRGAAVNDAIFGDQPGQEHFCQNFDNA